MQETNCTQNHKEFTSIDTLRQNLFALSQSGGVTDMRSAFVACGFLAILSNILPQDNKVTSPDKIVGELLSEVDKLLQQTDTLSHLTADKSKPSIDLDSSLFDLDIPLRTATLLKIKKMNTIRDVLALTERDFHNMYGFGNVPLSHLKVGLAKAGLRLKN
jgi:hypothetical protein